MITVPTAPSVHAPFDLLAWTSGAVLGRALHRWRLKRTALDLAHATGPAASCPSRSAPRRPPGCRGRSTRCAIPCRPCPIRCWAQWSEPSRALRPTSSPGGLRGSTGALFVGPFAVGIAVGRWGCLFAGLPDVTYGTPTALPWAVDLGDGVGRHPVHGDKERATMARAVNSMRQARR